MSITLLCILVGATGVLMLIERAGVPVVLALNFKGDLKRETRWLAQYGQGACTLAAAGIVWRLDGRVMRFGLTPAAVLLIIVFGVSLVSTIIKRVVGRVRPGRERAGEFLGPTLGHANFRESFPSSHSACAVAMSVVLARLYPPAAGIFWGLAIACAGLRYLMDAHWPSDVVGGVALGYAAACLAAEWMMGA
jgi:membrane-associated phospholipid phosphatase